MKPELPEGWRKKVRATVKEGPLMPRDYTQIYNVMLLASSKEEFHNLLTKNFPAEKAGKKSGTVKSVFEEYLKK